MNEPLRSLQPFFVMNTLDEGWIVTIEHPADADNFVKVYVGKESDCVSIASSLNDLVSAHYERYAWPNLWALKNPGA